MDTAWSSAAEIAEAVASGRVSASTVVKDALARIKARDGAFNSFTDVLAERAQRVPVRSTKRAPPASHSGRSRACHSR